MLSRELRPGRLGLVAGAMIWGLVACGGTDDAAADSAAVAGMADTTMPATVPSPTAGPVTLEVPTGEAGIADALATVNQAEVEAARLARENAQHARVKAYARRMADEHSRNMRNLGELARRANIAMTVAATDSADSAATGAAAGAAGASNTITQLRTMHEQTMQRLRSATGAAFDSAYVNSQVMAHTQTLDLLQRSRDQLQNAQLRQHVETTITAVQKHLDEARELQTAVGGAAGAAGTTDTAARDTAARDTARRP